MDQEKDQKQENKQEDLNQEDTDKEAENEQVENLSDLVDEEVKPNLSKSSFEQQPQIEKSSRKFKWGVLIIILTSVLAVGFFLTQKKNTSQPSRTPQPTRTPSFSPTPTPKPIFNRSDWTLEILNGSGITGAAKKVADKLQDLGYKIIKVGNADKSDYDKTQLFISKDLQSKSDLLIQDIKEVIKIASLSGVLKDSTASARIILGKDYQ